MAAEVRAGGAVESWSLRTAGILSIASVGGLLAGPAAALSVQTIALEGQPAPGTSRFFDSLSAPFINEGQVAFESLLRDTPEAPEEPGYPIFHALHAGAPSTLFLAAQQGGAAPGVAGATFTPEGLGGLNDAGDIAFHGTLSGPSVTPANDGVVYAGAPLTPALAAREGDPAPGVPGAIIDSFGLRFGASIAATGRIVFRSELPVGTGGVTGFNESLILGGTPSSIGLVAREGDPAPGAPPGAVYRDNLPSFPGLTESGTVYFREQIQVGSSSPESAFFAGPLASPTLVMQRGDELGPDLPGAQLSTLSGHLNDADQGIFTATFLIGPGGITSSNNLGILAGSFGSYQLLLQRGQAVPGAPGSTLSFADDSTIGACGHFSVRADLRDAFDNPRGSLLSGTQAELRALAVEGMQAPGLPAGAFFSSFLPASAGTSNITDTGVLAFDALLQVGAGGVTSSNDQVLYLIDGTGQHHLLLREATCSSGAGRSPRARWVHDPRGPTHDGCDDGPACAQRGGAARVPGDVPRRLERDLSRRARATRRRRRRRRRTARTTALVSPIRTRPTATTTARATPASSARVPEARQFRDPSAETADLGGDNDGFDHSPDAS